VCSARTLRARPPRSKASPGCVVLMVAACGCSGPIRHGTPRRFLLGVDVGGLALRRPGRLSRDNTEPRGSGVGLCVLEAGWDVSVGVEDAQDVEVVRLLEVEDEVGEALNRV
jgi:hypothetical protein